MRILAALLTVLALGLTACIPNTAPETVEITTVEPQSEHVAGAYLLQTQTLVAGDMSALQGRAPVLTLGPDGIYTAVDFPIWHEAADGYVLGGFATQTGTWMVDVMGAVDDTSAYGIWLEPPVDPLALPNLIGNAPPYGLMFSYGDPDSGKLMRLRRN
jgi:hypothetical protein